MLLTQVVGAPVGARLSRESKMEKAGAGVRLGAVFLGVMGDCRLMTMSWRYRGGEREMSW